MDDDTEIGRYWRSAMLWLIVVGLLPFGCGDGCVNSEATVPEMTVHKLAEAVPGDATAVLFADELEELLPRLNGVTAALPVKVAGPGEAVLWEQAGAKLDAPAVAFWADDQWVVLAWNDPEHEGSITDWPVEGEREIFENSGQAVEEWRESDSGGPWQRWASSNGMQIAAGWSLRDGAEPLAQQMWSLGGSHWTVNAHQYELQDEDDDGGAAFGAIDAAALLSQLGGEGRAAFMIDQLAQQIGTVYWMIRPGESKEEWIIDLYTPGDGDVPVAVGDMGQARGDLPPLGGLARPGVPGVVRISAQPEKLIGLLRSTLQVEERRRLDETIESLRDEVSVDLEADFIGNIKGQFAVVFFGLEDEFFESKGLGRIATLARLEATREAVVVPIEDRENMQRVLDSFTQLSQGGLRRQAMEHTIQYAWFDDTILKWAVILSDEHLVIVDSMVAFDHVGSWERSPQPLEGVFAERDVEAMLTPKRGMGVYLDAATLRGIAREGGDETLVEWLEPVEALQLRTDIGGERSRSRISLWLSSRVFEEERDDEP